MMFDRRLITNFDWSLLTLALTLSLVGVVNLYSASSFSLHQLGGQPYYLKQTCFLIISLLVSLAMASVDYQAFYRHSYLLHAISLALLISVLTIGKPVGGATRWLQVGGFSFQPSELSKLTLVLMLSRYFSRTIQHVSYNPSEFFLPAISCFLTFLLIFLEPDLGTAGFIVIVSFSFLAITRLRLKHIVTTILLSLILLPCSWLFLEDYQKRRVLSFLGPGKDPLHTGYHALQSKIAVGSGMLLGKGYLGGTQSQLRFLPEQHTDFAFSVLAEEWGFVGALFVLFLIFLIMSKALRIASQSRDRFGSFVAIGCFLILFWQVFINIGMVVGLLPIVGMTLPFVSYGGSSLITSWIVISLLLNIKMRRLLF